VGDEVEAKFGVAGTEGGKQDRVVSLYGTRSRT
jgi:hypothetical protein